MKHNIRQLKADIAALEVRIREVKTPLRQTWTDPYAMAINQSALVYLRIEVTRLIITRAWHRGKLHRRNAPQHYPGKWDAAAYAQEVYDRFAPKYEIVEEAEAV